MGPDKYFEKPYSAYPDRNSLFNIKLNERSGALDLSQSFMGTSHAGTYKARLRALDKNGQQVGLCGDHFIVEIN
jgi:hypothetical protein